MFLDFYFYCKILLNDILRGLSHFIEKLQTDQSEGHNYPLWIFMHTIIPTPKPEIRFVNYIDHKFCNLSHQ